jgi:hypothetical protein
LLPGEGPAPVAIRFKLAARLFASGSSLTMKVALAPYYRNWMMALFPTTLGLGTALLWLCTLNCPQSIDETGVTLRYGRRVGWCSIRKIGVSRSYFDGHVSQVRIYYDGGASKIPVARLQDGQDVVRIILAAFALVTQARMRQSDAPNCQGGASL